MEYLYVLFLSLGMQHFTHTHTHTHTHTNACTQAHTYIYHVTKITKLHASFYTLKKELFTQEQQQRLIKNYQKQETDSN